MSMDAVLAPVGAVTDSDDQMRSAWSVMNG